jgi:DNA-directed RNA polymerase
MLYYCDFRGRIYPATAYLHEQGSDLAKGLLLRESGKALGEQGFYWLCISLANNWAGESGREDGAKTDKIPLNERVYWALDNEEILLSYADNPKVNQGWMKADKAWQFLAACFELLKFRAWQVDNSESFDYVSHIEVFIDGSTNGSQHLAALTRDEVTAPHVNLVPSKLPGDLYAYTANNVWDEIHKNLMEIPLDLQQQCQEVIEELVDQMRAVHEHAADVELRKKLVEKLQSFKRQNKEYIEISSPIFWSKITDRKHRRKILKRNIMTLPYGGTSYGLGKQSLK